MEVEEEEGEETTFFVQYQFCGACSHAPLYDNFPPQLPTMYDSLSSNTHQVCQIHTFSKQIKQQISFREFFFCNGSVVNINNNNNNNKTVLRK